MRKRPILLNGPQAVFDSLPTRTSLIRTRNGRPVLPPLASLNVISTTYFFSDDDLKAILAEVSRRRRRWRMGHYIKLSMLTALGGWIGWLWWVVATGLR